MICKLEEGINTVNYCPKRNQKSDDFNADFEHAPICWVALKCPKFIYYQKYILWWNGNGLLASFIFIWRNTEIFLFVFSRILFVFSDVSWSSSYFVMVNSE